MFELISYIVLCTLMAVVGGFAGAVIGQAIFEYFHGE